MSSLPSPQYVNIKMFCFMYGFGYEKVKLMMANGEVEWHRTGRSYRLKTYGSGERPGDLDGKRILRTSEVVEICNVTLTTIKAWRKSGRLRHHRFGKSYRYSIDDVRQALAAPRKKPAARAGMVRKHIVDFAKKRLKDGPVPHKYDNL